MNYPFEQIQQHLPRILEQCKQVSAPDKQLGCCADTTNSAITATSAPSMSEEPAACPEIYVVCRRGNDSQLVVDMLQKHGLSTAQDLIGGLTAWSTEVDQSFPTY